MVVETLLYLQTSNLNATSVILQPEITHKPTFIDADLVDPQLTIECLYRIFRTVRIRAGRQTLSESLTPRLRSTRWYRYDPIITVQDNEVQFEAFSNDMTHYCCITLNETSFKNIHDWELGQTNVDFTPEFITNLRKAGPAKIKSLAVDPEGFYVDTEKESYHEKKVELPENWTIGLQNLRDLRISEERGNVLESPKLLVSKTPFGPLCNLKLATVEEGWIPRENWQFVKLNLKDQLGDVIIGKTSQPFERFDGRQNPRYDIIRSSRLLRKIKSYFLETTKVSAGYWKVKGSSSGKIRTVQRVGNWFTCDCEDFQYRSRGRPGFQCKHIRTVLKPQVDIISLDGDTWEVYELDQSGRPLQKYCVTCQDQKITCDCSEYKKLNICYHIIKVLEHEKDFQFNELKRDIC